MPRSPKLHKPDFLIDRSLGRYLIPLAITNLGYTVHTLASMYGERESQSVPDHIWLEEAGNRGLIVLTKDVAIRRNRLAVEAVSRFRVKLFVITTAKLTGEQQRDRILANIHRTVQASKTGSIHLRHLHEGLAPALGTLTLSTRSI